jgi:hypothetical protein
MMRVFLRPLWFVALFAHAAGAGLWWTFMPGGFPLSHSRFWVNRFLPILIIVLALSALFAAAAQRPAWLRLVLVGLGSMWFAAASASPAIFPTSGWWLGLAFLLFALATSGAAMAARLSAPMARKWIVTAAVTGAALGLPMPWTQRGPDPATRPLNEPLHAADVIAASELRTTLVTLTANTTVQTAEGVVTARHHGYEGVVEPMLTFNSRSPDRCWSILAPNPITRRPRHRFAGFEFVGDGLRMAFADPEGPAFLNVRPRAGEPTIDIESTTRLFEPVYSHLNSFCVVSMMGHTRASLRFSPCPDQAIDVLFAEYPVGRPSRGAYLSRDGAFRVIEADSGEKGPFHTLATGRLRRGEPLVVTFCDNGRPVMRAVIHDWSAQASDRLSPTAGWRVTENSLEFVLERDYAEAPATLFVSLAGTSLGRGFDTVGHAAGTYRSRVTLEMLSGE